MKHRAMKESFQFCSSIFRIIVLGELTVAKSPDCDECPREYKRKPAEVIVHEKFDDSIGQSPYDLALIRVNKSLTLFDENQSGVVPICLPWAAGNPVEYLQENDG